jgi:hypothetical protein
MMTSVPVLIDGPGGRLVKVVQEVLAAFGDPEDLLGRPISLRVPGGVHPGIEIVGRGPRGGPLISITPHDQTVSRATGPELFELIPTVAWWWPASHRLVRLGPFHEPVVFDGERFLPHPRLVDSLAAFVDEWDLAPGG